ncbi:glycosyltransferase family 2 protein [Nonlabens sp. SY33080]|uniref:glycosyltransferase family 2 protein n=1 Tax=Nonlabens sp. SY33080 TaxID=2719911 RepID=UPI001428A10C|nr:glycosyltransferase family A protein [Nonlabens sp. SY33080]
MKAINSNITAVIPCYNDGKFIRQAVDSLLAQTLLPEQIIIVDDGSKAETRKILRSINHPLVEIVYQENQGVCSARNNAIALASTDYICTLDADDYFEPTFLEKAHKIISTRANVAVVCCHYQRFGNNNLERDVIKPLGGSVANFLVQNNGIASALFKKSCWEEVNGYDVSFDKGYEDWDFWISILKKGWNMYVIPEKLFNYRIKENSRDQVANANFDQELKLKIYSKHQDLYLLHAENIFAQLNFKNNLLKNTVSKTKNSLDYKIGASLLKPLRFVKSLFN